MFGGVVVVAASAQAFLAVLCHRSCGSNYHRSCEWCFVTAVAVVAWHSRGCSALLYLTLPSMADVWIPVKLQKELTFEGGFLRKSTTVDSKDIETPEGLLTFVRLDKSSEWLIKATSGSKAQRGALRRTTLLETLKDKLMAAVNPPTTTSAVADDDPMNALDICQHEPDTKKARYYVSKRAVNKITRVPMREHSHCTHPDKEDVRYVSLLAWSTNQLWISADDLEWLVRNLADEVSTGGVPTSSHAEEDLEPNCDIPNFHMRWNVRGAWEGFFINGPLQGKEFISWVGKITPDKWEIAERTLHYNVALADASKDQKRCATFAYVEHCMRIAAEEAP